MDSVPKITLGCFVRCHARADTLDILLSELERYGTLPGIATKIHVWADRPTWRCERVLDTHRSRLWGLHYSQFPLVSANGGERFMEALELQRQMLAKTHCDWFGLFDDDRWLLPAGATTELPLALASPDIDMWYAKSVFFEDRADQFNAAREHRSPLLWRVVPGDEFPRNRMIQATEAAHDSAIMSGRVGDLKTPLLDYGSFTAAERQRLYTTYARAGKNDAYTASYVAPTRLSSFPDDAIRLGLVQSGVDWRDLYTEAKQCS